MMTAEQVAVQLAEWVKCVAHQPWVFLLLVNVALLLLGIFVESLPATLLTAPLFMPLAQVFKIDMAHFGIVMTANLAIALYIPAVGGTLFVAANLAKAGIGQINCISFPPCRPRVPCCSSLPTFQDSRESSFGCWRDKRESWYDWMTKLPKDVPFDNSLGPVILPD